MRIIAALLGLLLIAGVVWLGILSGTNSGFVVWFGIASAIGAPIGLTCLAFALRGRQPALDEDLKKVPEIQRLIAEAKTKEEQVRLLEAERLRLRELIVQESHRLALEARREAITTEAGKLLQEAEVIDAELARFGDDAGSVAEESLGRLRTLLQAEARGDMVLELFNQTIVVTKDMFFLMPLGGFLYYYIRALKGFMDSRLKKLLP